MERWPALDETEFEAAVAKMEAEWDEYRGRLARYNLFVRIPAAILGGWMIGWGLSQTGQGKPFWAILLGIALLAGTQLAAPLPKPPMF